MKYTVKGHDRAAAVHELLICLLPDEEHTAADWFEEGENCALSYYEDGCAHAEVRYEGKIYRADVPCSKETRELAYGVKTSLFLAMRGFVPQTPWGSVTGVKPAKAFRADGLLELPRELAEKTFGEKFFVDAHRSRLTCLCAGEAQRIELGLERDEVQLYVGIPFCPSRCSYCSFVSAETAKSGSMIPDYLDALILETAAAGDALRDAGKKIGSVYFGGGTPTTLSAGQLDRLICAVKNAFVFRGDTEWTVECGRPDTITPEKLSVLAAHSVGRLSINPQTSRDSVLAAVGRPHTWHDIVRAYSQARAAGDFSINMDLIAGLPEDSEQGLYTSVIDVMSLRPEDITLHSLALKKGADLRFGPRGMLETRVLDRCHSIIESGGYAPYYLYKQKYSAGGLENVGFCRPGGGSKYNVVMMEELGDVLALGSGGVSKFTGTGTVARVQNPKYPREYIQRAGEIIKQKRDLVF